MAKKIGSGILDQCIDLARAGELRMEIDKGEKLYESAQDIVRGFLETIRADIQSYEQNFTDDTPEVRAQTVTELRLALIESVEQSFSFLKKLERLGQKF